jgi:uncharacterized membrane protein HdeD (DUF308 family)
MKIDRQDVLLVIGVLSLLAGIGCWSKPAALVVLGLMCLGFVAMIERAKPQNGSK